MWSFLKAINSRLQHPPGPSGYPLLGVLPRLVRDPLGVLQEVAGEFGDVVYLGAAPGRVYLVNHPSLVQHILQEHADRYGKGQSVDRVRPLLGEGLTTSDGVLWQRQRRLLAPLFHQQAISSLAPVIVRTTGDHLDRWFSRANDDVPLDLLGEMLDLTRSIMIRILFGDRPDTEVAALQRAVAEAIEETDEHVWRLSMLPPGLPFAVNRVLQRRLDALDELLFAQIRAHQCDDTGNGDMLDALLSLRDPKSGEALDQKQLRDEIVTLFVAGHTTTAAALCWTWILLHHHPGVRRRLEQELGLLPDARTLSFADLEDLVFLRAVVDEALRLYPPTWLTARTSLVDDDIGGYRVPSGSTILLCPYLIHRDARIWHRPDEFEPERFLAAAGRRHPFSYFPFGGGPRACPGRSFALLEIQFILALVLNRCWVELQTGQELKPRARITLRPAAPVRFFPRIKKNQKGVGDN